MNDIEIRNRTYALFAELGRAPRADEVGEPGQIREAWRRLNDAHALVLDPEGEIRMANPFSAVPTRYRVQADGRSWYANCAWDAFGICAALHVDGHIETTCPDCNDPIEVDVVDQQPSDTSLVFHCLVPAREWWENIVFT